jgi:hypothetical protein
MEAARLLRDGKLLPADPVRAASIESILAAMSRPSGSSGVDGASDEVGATGRVPPPSDPPLGVGATVGGPGSGSPARRARRRDPVANESRPASSATGSACSSVAECPAFTNLYAPTDQSGPVPAQCVQGVCCRGNNSFCKSDQDCCPGSACQPSEIANYPRCYPK